MKVLSPLINLTSNKFLSTNKRRSSSEKISSQKREINEQVMRDIYIKAANERKSHNFEY
jgi:hypothetical protein